MEIRQVSKSQSVVHGLSDPNQRENGIADQEEKTLLLKSPHNCASFFIILTGNQPFNISLYSPVSISCILLFW